MGRKKIFGLVLVTSLTVLNIWMAKYVIRPLNQAKRNNHDVASQHGRKLSDVLVVSVDDVHPLEHLQEAAGADEKRKTTIPAHFQSKPQRTDRGTPEHGYNNYGRQHSVTNENTYTRSNVSAPNFVNDINPSNSSPSIPLDTENRQDSVVQNGLSDLRVSDMGRGDLEMLDTAELINIKHNLEVLMHLLGQLNAKSITVRPMSTQTTNSIQNAWQENPAKYHDTNVKDLGGQIYGGNVLSKTTPTPNENSILNYFKYNFNPPVVAAPALPGGPYTDLINTLLSETNVEKLQLIIKENAGSVRELLSQILDTLRQRQQVIQSLLQQQHHQPRASTLGSKQQLKHKEAYVSRDYNKNVAKEMMNNILKYNNPHAYASDGRVVDNFRQHFQMSYLPTDFVLR